MSRVPRSSLSDGYFHVYARGVDRSHPLFRDDDDRGTFIDVLSRVAARYRWTCHAFCVLGTHYHLVVAASTSALSSGMHALNWTYARYYNARYRRFGHVFADRFASRTIEDESYLYDACAYVTQNPVAAGLCERAEDWPWSYSAFGSDSS